MVMRTTSSYLHLHRDACTVLTLLPRGASGRAGRRNSFNDLHAMDADDLRLLGDFLPPGFQVRVHSQTVVPREALPRRLAEVSSSRELAGGLP
jgi:hypothetical protein